MIFAYSCVGAIALQTQKSNIPQNYQYQPLDSSLNAEKDASSDSDLFRISSLYGADLYRNQFSIGHNGIEIGSSVSPNFSSFKVDSNISHVASSRTIDVSPSEVTINQVSPFQVNSTQVGIPEVTSSNQSTTQIHRPIQTNIAQISTTQIGFPEVDIAEMGTSQIKSTDSQIDSRQINIVNRDIREIILPSIQTPLELRQSSNFGKIITDTAIGHNSFVENSIPTDFDIGHVSPSEIDSVEFSSNEIGSNEISPTQIDLSKVTAPEIGISQIGTSQIGVDEKTLSETSLSQSGSAQISIDDQSTNHSRTTQVGSTQINSNEIGATTEINTIQIETSEISLPSQETLTKFLAFHNLTFQIIDRINTTALNFWNYYLASQNQLNIDFQITDLPSGQLVGAINLRSLFFLINACKLQ